MFLTALSRAPAYCYIDEPLAFFRAHDQSITVNALQDPASTQKLTDAYNEYKLAFLSGAYASRLAQMHVGQAVQAMLKQVAGANPLGF